MRQPLLKVTSKPRKTPEANLQACVVQHIRLCKMPNLVWGSSMSGIKLGIRAAARMKAQGMEAGEPDLYFLIGGYYYGLELKNGDDGVQSKVQKDFEKRVFASGGTYVIARNIHQALVFLETWGAIRPRTQTKLTYSRAA